MPDDDTQRCDNCNKVCFETRDLWIQGFQHYYTSVRNAADEPVEQECMSKSFALSNQPDYVVWCVECYRNRVWPELKVLLTKWMEGGEKK